jgi:hypothetical protein
MGKNKRKTRSSAKTNNKTNRPSRAHKRKQRRRNNELKAAIYSAENTPESNTVGLGTNGAGRTRRQQRLFVKQMNGSTSTDNDDETKKATEDNTSPPPAQSTNTKTDPALKPKNLFTKDQKKAPTLTNQADLTTITINGQLEIVCVADETGTIDGMSTDDPQPEQVTEANSEIDPDAASYTDSSNSPDIVDKKIPKFDSRSSLGSDDSSSVSTLPGSCNKRTGTKKARTSLDDPNQAPDTTDNTTEVTTTNITTHHHQKQKLHLMTLTPCKASIQSHNPHHTATPPIHPLLTPKHVKTLLPTSLI